MIFVHGLIIFVQALLIGMLWRQSRAIRWIVEQLEQRHGATAPDDVIEDL